MSRWRLHKVVFSALKWNILAPVLARLALIAFTICQSVLLDSFLRYLAQPEGPNSQNHGYGFMAAYAIVYLGIGV